MQKSYQIVVSELVVRSQYILLSLVFCGAASYYYSTELLLLLLRGTVPTKLDCPSLVSTCIEDSFYCSVLLSVYVSFLCTFPYICYSLFCFLKPGWYKSDARAFISILWSGFIGLCISFLIFFTYVIPRLYSFFLEYSNDFSVSIVWTVSNFLLWFSRYFWSWMMVCILFCVFVMFLWKNLIPWSFYVSNRFRFLIVLSIMFSWLFPLDLVISLSLLFALGLEVTYVVYVLVFPTF